MKLYISADIEGVAGICSQTETNLAHKDSVQFCQQMSDEVAAACAAGFKNGVNEIVIKDAHWTGRNIDPKALTAPDGKSLSLIRGWSGDPMGMVQELDGSYDAAVFIGYHSSAGNAGNPLSHTMCSKFAEVRLNGMDACEAIIYGYAAAMHQVPLLLVSGDQPLCQKLRDVFPGVHTIEVLEGKGNSVRSILPETSIKLINQQMEKALSGSLPTPITLPGEFELVVKFNNHADAFACSFYPDAELISAREVSLKTNDYAKVLACLWFFTK